MRKRIAKLQTGNEMQAVPHGAGGPCQGQRGPRAKAPVSLLPGWPLVRYGMIQALLSLRCRGKGPGAHHAKAEGIRVHGQPPRLDIVLGKVSQGATHGLRPGHCAALAGTGPRKAAEAGQAEVSQLGHQSLIQEDVGTWGGKEQGQVSPGQLRSPCLLGPDSTGLGVAQLMGGSLTRFSPCSPRGGTPVLDLCFHTCPTAGAR